MAGSFSCGLGFWNIDSLPEFRKDLPKYKSKIHELDRIQIIEGADLKVILPVLWEEVLQQHPSTHLRFYLSRFRCGLDCRFPRAAKPGD